MKVKDLFEVWKGGTFYVVPSNFRIETDMNLETQVLFEADINDVEFKADEKFKKLQNKREKHLETLTNRKTKIFSSVTYTLENEPQTLDELKDMEIEAIKVELTGMRSKGIFVFVKNCSIIYT